LISVPNGRFVVVVVVVVATLSRRAKLPGGRPMSLRSSACSLQGHICDANPQGVTQSTTLQQNAFICETIEVVITDVQIISML